MYPRLGNPGVEDRVVQFLSQSCCSGGSYMSRNKPLTFILWLYMSIIFTLVPHANTQEMHNIFI